MKFFDFNIHLTSFDKFNNNSNLSTHFHDETTMTGKEFETNYSNYESILKDNCIGGNIMILNDSLTIFEIESLLNLTKSNWSSSCLSMIIDPRDLNWKKRISDLHEIGVKAIKFHSYIQELDNEIVPKCVEIAIQAEALGMAITIDTGYGTLGIYQFDNLHLALAIAKKVKKTPIILLHSGGMRCLEAMLIADARSNIYLETSFTLPYYLNSSIEQDLAFAYKKIGADKILYASDFPYVDLNTAQKIFSSFVHKHGFTDNQIEKMAYSNGMKIANLHG